MRERMHLRLTFLGLALSCLLLVIGRLEGKRLQAVTMEQEGAAVIAGARLYEDNCRKCHGARGEGLGQLGPALADKHFFSGRMAEVGWLLDIEGYVTTTTAGGRLMATRPLYAGNGQTAVMPPWALEQGGPLRGDEIMNIARFVMNWRATALGQIILPVVEVPQSDQQDPAIVKAGADIFAKHCLSCHALPGLAGGDGGPSLDGIAGIAAARVQGLSAADYIRQSVLIPAAFIVEGYGEKAETRGCGVLFSEMQLEEVTAFLMQQN